MRVATRRLRAFLKVAAPLLDETWSEPLREELAWLGGALGPARDLDVLEAHLRRAPSAPHPVEGYAFVDLRVDFRKAEALRDGVALDLSAREFQLLRYFV